jgi:hypothetical protein
MTGQPPDIHCSFCQKSHKEGRKTIAGPSAYICDECVEVCVDIIADDTRFDDGTGPVVLEPSPADVVVAPVAGGLAVRCSLCRIPVPIQDVLPIQNRGALCPGCVGEIEAAIAEKTDETA